MDTSYFHKECKTKKEERTKPSTYSSIDNAIDQILNKSNKLNNMEKQKKEDEKFIYVI